MRLGRRVPIVRGTAGFGGCVCLIKCFLALSKIILNWKHSGIRNIALNQTPHKIVISCQQSIKLLFHSTINLLDNAKTPWSWGRMYDFCTFFRMGRGIESRSFLFFYSWTFLEQTRVKKCGSSGTGGPSSREERRERRRRGKTGRRFRNGYEKGVRFVSERRLNG